MLKLVVCVSLGVLLYTSSVFSQDDSTCVDGPSSWYEGKRGYTKSGTTCQRWDVTTPHKPRQTPRDGGHHNFCRNPDGDLKGTWCYTMNVSKRWEYCDIPKCPDDSRVIWTNYDSSNGGAHILSVQADPEIVKNMTDHSGTFSVNVLVTSNQSRTEYWAVAADYNHNLFFYTDYMSEYIGVYYLKLNASEKKYEGMAHGIENMAYDWLTGNLYWTDSEFQWIMATEKSFTYYTPVYRTEGSPPYAITIHAKQRKLFFSIYKTYGSRIVSTDLAGKNETTIFQYPKVFDVTGLTIDYTDDRLYWTDFTGFGGMVLSSKTDGTNKTQHHYKGGAIFWGVSAYLDYLYVTDVHARYNTQAKKYYSVWVINKKFPSVFRYTLEGKPRGISVLSKNEERSMNTVPKLGSCMASNLCDHICLPRIGSKRECACSLGYTKVGDTKCVHNTVNDNYLLIADGGQGKVFQIDISQDNLGPDSNYSIVPLRDSKRISTVAVDVVSKTILWSDKRITQIKKALLDGSRTFSLTNGNHASSIAVDSLDGNVYFVDEDTQIIYVTTSNGRFTKTLSRPGKDQLNSTHIKMLTVDSRNSYLYWTDTRDGEDNGQVLRMKTDGTKREVVLDKLQWPHAITIDYERNSLFVAEAKLGMIYEKSLSNLTSITSTSSLSAKQQYDLAGHITRMRYYIVDIKVLNNTIYVIDGKSNRVEKFNLTAGPASITQLGPTEFYKITSIALYSEAYHKQYIANIPNPCSTRKYKCDEICLATSSNTSTCACADGKLSLGSACYEKLDRTVPPSYGTTCQRDQTLQLFPCQGKTRFTWNEPQWTDDRTASEKLSITKPSFVSPALLPIGDHVFTYTATDSDGNAAACSFTIIVQAKSNCMKTPELPPHLKQETKPCNLLWGAEYVVRCKDDKMMMMLKADVEKQAHRNITNMCLTNGSWYLKDWSLYSCITAPTTPAPGPKDKPTASSNGSGVNKSSGGGLATGPIVAIVIMVILLVVVIIAVIFVSIRNRPVWKVTRFAFPLFGKQKTEDTDTTQPSENPYSVMT